MEISMTNTALPTAQTKFPSSAGQTSAEPGSPVPFFSALNEKLGGGDKKAADPFGEELAWDALLQGLPAAWMSLMLPAPVDQASIPDPEKMAYLLGQLGNGASAQTAAEWTSWLAQAKDLLAGMGLLPSSSGPTGEGQAAQGISQEGETAADGKPSAEEGDILSTFLKAFKKEPGSELLQQLASTLQPLVASTMSRVLNPVGGTAASSQTDEGIRLALDKANPTAADAQESRRAEGKPRSAGEKAAAVLFAQPLNEDQKESGPALPPQTKPLTKLEVLALKSGVRERMVQQLKPEGALTPDGMVPVDHDLPEFTPVTVQDFLKTVPQENLKNQPVSAQSFAREMTQLVMKSFNVNPLNGMSEASLTLTPENLGKVEVKISVHNGQVIAHFAAQTVLGKEMIESQLSQLRLNLQNQGIQVERLEVAQASSLASGMFQDQRQQQSSQQFTRQNRERTIEAELTEEDYAKEISQLMNIRQQAFGATVDTTA